jgi:hypothetical protein
MGIKPGRFQAETKNAARVSRIFPKQTTKPVMKNISTTNRDLI